MLTEAFVALQFSSKSHSVVVWFSQTRNILSKYFIVISPFLFRLHSCLAWSLKTLMKASPREGVGLYIVCTSSLLNCFITILYPLLASKHWILWWILKLSQNCSSRNCRHWQISRPSFIQLKFDIHSEISLCESSAKKHSILDFFYIFKKLTYTLHKHNHYINNDN